MLPGPGKLPSYGSIAVVAHVLQWAHAQPSLLAHKPNGPSSRVGYSGLIAVLPFCNK